MNVRIFQKHNRSGDLTHQQKSHLGLLRPNVVAGSCAIAIAMGMARLDFGAIGRLMVQDHWIKASGIGELAGLSLLAFLLGSIHHTQLRARSTVLRTMFFAAVLLPLSFWIAVFEADFIGQAFTRVLAGWSAAHLMSGMPGLALEGAPAMLRRRDSGMVLAGGGFGALIGAFAIGIFAPNSARGGWIVMALIATVLTLPVVWLIRTAKAQNSRPGSSTTPEAPIAAAGIKPKPQQRWRVGVLICGGGLLVGAGQIPICLYAPIVVYERLGGGASLSSESLAVFGLGSAIGALSAAFLPRHWPTALILPLVSLIGLLGSVLFLFSNSLSTILSATLLIGIWMWMTIPLTYDRLGELGLSTDVHRRVWALMSTLAGLGYATFSLSTAGLTSQHLKTVLFLGVLVIVLQFTMENLQRIGSTKMGREQFESQ